MKQTDFRANDKVLIGFIKNYCMRNFLRLHVPGHQGRCGFLNKKLAAKFDITEVSGADWLFDSCGVLANLEHKLKLLFGSSAAISTCGSTLCVQAMVALCRNKTFIAHRSSAHVSFFNACALLKVKVVWFGCDDDFGLNFFDLNEIEINLAKHEIGSCAVYLTSPDYFGVQAPLEQILKVCRKFRALCLVDCAHGAHLNFVKKGSHPAFLGVDLCCSSLHKTLPALTGAAVLNFNEKLFSKARVKAAMSVFSTTSPSYLIMASIDFCVDWLKKHGNYGFLKLLDSKKNLIQALNLPFLKTDVSKLVIDCRKINLTGFQLAEVLRVKKIEPEFADENFVVMVLSPFLRRSDWRRLRLCLSKVKFNFVPFKQVKIKKTSRFLANGDFINRLNLITEIKDRQIVAVNLNEKAVGRIVSKHKFKSPPGTLMVAAGERLTHSMVLKLQNFGETKIEVLD